MKSLNSSDADLQRLAVILGQATLARGWTVVTAESCTGGWIAQAITSVAGSSQWFDRGFVTYTNASKQDMVDVAATTLEQFGAVSQQTVTEMARGALARSRANLAVAVSGIAGPGGATPDKPVGTVWFAWASAGGTLSTTMEMFAGDRESVRRQAVAMSLHGLIELAHG